MLNGFGDAAEIEKTRRGIEDAQKVRVGYNGADLTKPDQIESLMKECVDEFGAVDILVNNAGVQHVAPVDEFPVEKWDLIIALNLTGAFHTTRLALPDMKKKGWGRVINTASPHSLRTEEHTSPYVTAKHGLARFPTTVAPQTPTRETTP